MFLSQAMLSLNFAPIVILIFKKYKQWNLDNSEFDYSKYKLFKLISRDQAYQFKFVVVLMSWTKMKLAHEQKRQEI